MGLYSTDIQKRREKKLSDLRKEYGVTYPTERGRNNFPPDHMEEKLGIKWIIQLLVSILLVVSVFYGYQTDNPYGKKAQQFVNQFMTREYNFDGVYKWYTEKFNGYPAIIPTFAIKEKGYEQHDVNFEKPILDQPVRIIPTKSGVYFETIQSEPIISMEKGIVIFAGTIQDIGKTVKIRHQNGYESTYGMLTELNVEKDEWVEAGQSLGVANDKFYLEMSLEDQYINPLDVIVFDQAKN